MGESQVQDKSIDIVYSNLIISIYNLVAVASVQTSRTKSATLLTTASARSNMIQWPTSASFTIRNEGQWRCIRSTLEGGQVRSNAPYMKRTGSDAGKFVASSEASVWSIDEMHMFDERVYLFLPRSCALWFGSN